MPRAVVTGGAGFLGSHLCDALRARGWEVVAVDNFLTGRAANVAHLADDAGFTLVEHDVIDGIPVGGPVDAVLHLASPASPPRVPRAPDRDARGRRRSARATRSTSRAHDGARFLLASTSEIYGDPLVHPQPESYFGNVNSVGPRSVYDEAKRYAEAITMAYHRDVRRRHEDRAHLQHLRPLLAAGRRPGRVELPRPGDAAARRSPSTATARRRGRSAT